MTRLEKLQRLVLPVTVLLCTVLWLGAAESKKKSGQRKQGPPREEWQQAERVMHDLNLKPGQAVADIGCGSGYFTFRLAEAVGPTGKVFAADIDRKSVKTVQDRATREGLTQVRAYVSSPTRTLLDPACLDAALMCDVLHHVPEDQRVPLLTSIAESLKPGGFFFLLDWKKEPDIPFDPYDRKIARDDLIRYAKEAGMVLDAEFLYLKYQVFLRFQKPAP
ncbi:MAG: class I SAM-dependent methyltransferase [Candidatus Sumerlaeia bacterium]|nr:class I SAM-dependent methyltransferase [Candidatus Sumerlaeia bacterium]